MLFVPVNRSSHFNLLTVGVEGEILGKSRIIISAYYLYGCSDGSAFNYLHFGIRKTCHFICKEILVMAPCIMVILINDNRHCGFVGYNFLFGFFIKERGNISGIVFKLYVPVFIFKVNCCTTPGGLASMCVICLYISFFGTETFLGVCLCAHEIINRISESRNFCHKSNIGSVIAFLCGRTNKLPRHGVFITVKNTYSPLIYLNTLTNGERMRVEHENRYSRFFIIHCINCPGNCLESVVFRNCSNLKSRTVHVLCIIIYFLDTAAVHNIMEVEKAHIIPRIFKFL